MGFFQTRSDQLETSIETLGGIPVERLRELGTKAIRGMNPHAKNPELAPEGAAQPFVYVLGSHPSDADDAMGKHFRSSTSALLLQSIPQSWWEEVRFNYCVRTLPPPGRKENEPVKDIEVECFRNSVVDDIVATRPPIVIGVGKLATEWMLGPKRFIKACRGRRFPCKLKDHVFWFYPIVDPEWIATLEVKRDSDADQAEWIKTFRRDVRRPFSDAANLTPPTVIDPKTWLERVQILDDTNDILDALAMLREEKVPLTGDLETTWGRPYKAGAKLLSASVGTPELAIAFSMHHPERDRTDFEAAAILEAMYDTFAAAPRVTFHNLNFDLEWLAYNRSIFGNLRNFHCTMNAAFVIDNRTNSHSLDFQTQQYFGFRVKDVTGVDRADLANQSLLDVLPYNGLDVIATAHLDVEQQKIIKERKLEGAIREQVKRVPCLVKAQIAGFPVKQDTMIAIQDDTQSKLKGIDVAIQNDASVDQYRKRFGSFNPTDECITVLLRDVLSRQEGVRGKKYSVDAEVLESIDLPIAKLLLKHRKFSKMLSTYIKPFLAGTEGSVIYPDGLLHTSYNTTFVDTGRLSSDGPNLQNIPNRDPEARRVRMAFGWKEGYTLVAADYGAAEARTIAMFSRDKVLCDFLWADNDIHAVWTHKIYQLYPDTFLKRYGPEDDKKAFKAARGDVKNQLVFPAFYGSMLESCARSLDIPRDIFAPLYHEFWDTFRGVKSWQEQSFIDYDKNGYVCTLTGRPRQGPLTKNMVMNSPVQGTASDIVVDAMDRCSLLAVQSERPWLQPRLNVHDDITFLIPDEKLEESLEDIIKTLCFTPFSFVNVPIAIEVKVGQNWCEMSDIGTFASNKL